MITTEKTSPFGRSPEGREKIKNIIDDFFAKIRVSNFEIKVIEAIDGEALNINLSTDEAGFFIGENGRNIGAFEEVLRLVIKKQLGEAPIFHLDINNYRSLKEGALRELAKKAAHRARFYKREVVLETMSAYDRRIIHTELAIHPDIKTESTGTGDQRHVVVKYIN